MTDEQQPAWAARLQAEREARDWSKREMARRLFTAAGIDNGNVGSLARQISWWENGRHFPRDWAAIYAIVLETSTSALFGPEHRTPPAVDVDQQRRRLLSCLGALGVEAAMHTEPLEPIREALLAALPDDHDGRMVRDWEETAFEYGHAFLTTPPGELLSDLATDLVGLQQELQRTSAEHQRRRLCVPAGKLTALMAMTVSTLGQPRQARNWWKTARHTADASGDRDLRVWVRGYEAMSALYAGRPHATVLRLADEAIVIAGKTPGAAVLEAMAGRAQVLALAGQRAEAEATINAMGDRFASLPGSDPEDRLSTTAWPETALHHTAAFTFSHGGNTARAEAAQEHALALYPAGMRRQRAQVALLRAVTLIQQGEITAAVVLAGDTVGSLAVEQRTTTIRRGARMVLDAIPDAELSRPVVQDYRAALALPSASRSPEKG
ncbi:helix-turn-helix domain-containing protein [Actinomadura hibisca]|uniref:helix-turn-helix domain-containing protein n=1 Tax=Actinomadura hibisca TaxID=68565 RepID=UPI00082AE698|nr:helix-turn-helix transcriptional regulator [Actinomadura hibisca]